MNRALTLWLLLDGKPGHENQSLGLAEAIGRLTPSTVHQIPVAAQRGPLGRIRTALGLATLLIPILTFMPEPLRLD